MSSRRLQTVLNTAPDDWRHLAALVWSDGPELGVEMCLHMTQDCLRPFVWKPSAQRERRTFKVVLLSHAQGLDFGCRTPKVTVNHSFLFYYLKDLVVHQMCPIGISVVSNLIQQIRFIY